MRRTSYQRGFAAGELWAIEFIERQIKRHPAYMGLELERREVQEIASMVAGMGPVARIAGIVNKQLAGEDIAADDYEDWSEEELRDERGRIEHAIEEALYLGTRRGHDDEETARGRALQRVPEHLRDGLTLYLDEHRLPGHFLTAVLMNDLAEAMGRADNNSRAGLFDIVAYLHNYAPAPAWGGKRQVELWTSPAIPRWTNVTLGDQLEVQGDGRTACPQCGGAHLVHHAAPRSGHVELKDEGPMKQEHTVQYVWCQQVHLVVVGVDGREVETWTQS